jgi:hypothetical protein
VVARLDDRGHPNKVSMKKRKKRKEGKPTGEEGGIYRRREGASALVCGPDWLRNKGAEWRQTVQTRHQVSHVHSL